LLLSLGMALLLGVYNRNTLLALFWLLLLFVINNAIVDGKAVVVEHLVKIIAVYKTLEA